MSCPICDNKAANCDCSADAIRLHEENANLRAENDQYRRRRVEEENGNLRAGMEAMQRSHMDDMGLAIEQRDKAYRELDAMKLQNEGMRMLLEQFRDSLHLHEHDAKVPVENCPKPPCQKVMKYAEKGNPEKEA